MNKKRLKNIFDWVFIIVGIVFIISPREYKNIAYTKMFDVSRSVRLRTFENAEGSDGFEESKKYVIDRINNSKIIFNKKELIDRVNNVAYKYNGDSFLLNGIDENIRMFYLFDKISNKDYIINNDIYYTSNMSTLIHELNHLVDLHKKVSINIKPSSILKKYDRESYIKFYQSWSMIDRYLVDDMMVFGSKYLPNTDKVSIGDVSFSYISSDPSYYLSDSEIYARLSNMKAFLLGKCVIQDISEDITENDILITVESIKEMSRTKIETCEWEDDSYTILLLDGLDWIIYAPIIDYDKIDDLNLMI